MDTRRAHKLTRQELYDLVWSEPVSKIAPRYNISDVGFAKLCRRVDVPLPPRGYWAKLSAGKRVRKSPLKPAKNPKDEIVVIAERPRVEKAAMPADIAEAIAYEETEEARMVVPASVSKWHPIVQKWVDRENRPSQWGGSTRVRISAIERQRRPLLTTFFRALERRGWSVAEVERKGFSIKMVGQTITFNVMEITKRVEREKKERPGGYDWGPRYDHQPTGALRLRLHKSYSDTRDWNGTDDRPLETRLNEAIIGFLKQAAADRKREEEWAEQARRRERERQLQEEAAERVRQEKAKVDRLIRDAERWEQAKRVRLYVEEVARIRAGDPDVVEWRAWALEIADRIAPIGKGADKISGEDQR